MEVTYSNRGFKRFPPITGTHSDTTVAVYESSAAEHASIWVAMDGEVWTWDEDRGHTWPSGEKGDMTVHLPLEKAAELRDQLTFLIENHYHLA